MRFNRFSVYMKCAIFSLQDGEVITGIEVLDIYGTTWYWYRLNDRQLLLGLITEVLDPQYLSLLLYLGSIFRTAGISIWTRKYSSLNIKSIKTPSYQFQRCMLPDHNIQETSGEDFTALNRPNYTVSRSSSIKFKDTGTGYNEIGSWVNDAVDSRRTRNISLSYRTYNAVYILHIDFETFLSISGVLNLNIKI